MFFKEVEVGGHQALPRIGTLWVICKKDSEQHACAFRRADTAGLFVTRKNVLVGGLQKMMNAAAAICKNAIL